MPSQIQGISSVLSRDLAQRIGRTLYYKLDEIIRKASQSIVDTTSSSDITISSGVITLSGDKSLRLVTLDTEDGDATDDVDSISGGRVGDEVIFQSTSSARVITFKDNSALRLGSDFILNHPADKIRLIKVDETDDIWDEVSRNSNG